MNEIAIPEKCIGCPIVSEILEQIAVARDDSAYAMNVETTVNAKMREEQLRSDIQQTTTGCIGRLVTFACENDIDYTVIACRSSDYLIPNGVPTIATVHIEARPSQDR